MANPFMAMLAGVFYLAPLVLAVFIDRQTAAFQREAFGHLRRAAFYLRLTAWAVFVYYVGVLVGSAAIGDLRHMYEYPVAAEGVQIYVRIGAAIFGYVFLLLVARQLYEVTVPDHRRSERA